jgi:lysophospholipase L1-like esterase
MTCPASIRTESLDGRPIPLQFAATREGGVEPVTLTCTPASGALFAVGGSRVTCTAADAAEQTATCSFDVFVAQPPAIAMTKFLAFGDSITEGFLREEGFSLFRPLVIPEATYPYQLEQSLRGRFRGQAPIVVNAGLGGETADEGRLRIIDVLSHERPEVVLLLEGYNDIRETVPESIKTDLRLMIREGRAIGAETLLSTLTPITDERERGRPGTQTAIRAVNGKIRELAAEQGVELVDAFAAFGGDESLFGSDGLHPNKRGYARLAEAFYKAIVNKFETNPGTPPQPRP